VSCSIEEKGYIYTVPYKTFGTIEVLQDF